MLSPFAASSNSSAPAHPRALTHLREQILIWVGYITAGTAALALPLMLFSSWIWEQSGIFLFAMGIVALLTGLAATRRLNYRMRVYGMLLYFSALAIQSLLVMGLVGPGRLLVLFVMFLATVLLPRREIFVIWGLIGVATAIILTGHAIGWIPVGAWVGPRASDRSTILANTVLLFWIIGVVGWPALELIRQLTKILGETEQAVIERDLANANLERLVAERQRAYAQAITSCSAALLTHHAEDLTGVLLDALEPLRAVGQCHRAYVYECIGDPSEAFVFQVVAEVCAPEVTSDPRTARIPSTFETAVFSDLYAGRPVEGAIDRLLIPTDYREMLHAIGVAGMLWMPVHVGGRLWGILGLSDVTADRIWMIDDRQMLQTASEMIAAFIQGHRLLHTLRERDHFIQHIVGTSPDTIYVYDLLTRRNMFINRSLGMSLGYTEEEIHVLGDKPWRVLVLPEDIAGLAEFQARSIAAADNQVTEFEQRMRHKDGSIHWILNHEVVFARDTAGHPTQLLGIVRDITASKQAEARLTEQLRYAEALARCSHDLLVEGTGTTDWMASVRQALVVLREVIGTDRISLNLYQSASDVRGLPAFTIADCAAEIKLHDLALYKKK